MENVRRITGISISKSITRKRLVLLVKDECVVGHRQTEFSGYRHYAPPLGMAELCLDCSHFVLFIIAQDVHKLISVEQKLFKFN